MPTITQYLSQLQNDKQTLVDNLVSKGVDASNEETFTTLVPKINDIEAGGGDVSEYFDTEINVNPTQSKNILHMSVKKMPNLTIGTDVTSMAYAFAGYQGTNIPNLQILSDDITNFTLMFNGCSKLETIPEMDTSKGTDFSAMFIGCVSLTEIPLLNTSNGTKFNNMFYNCNKLETIPEIDTSNGTNFSYMFYASGISKLKTIPKLNLSKATNVSNMIYTSAGGNQSNFEYLENLGGFENLGEAYLTTSSANYSNYKFSVLGNVTGEIYHKLTHESLMNVINYLYDIKAKGCNTQQLILGSVGMGKLTAEEIAIATNKGWTVS